MSDLYRIERFGPDSERRFSAADAWMVDFEEGFAVVPVETVVTLTLNPGEKLRIVGWGGPVVDLPPGRYLIVEADDE